MGFASQKRQSRTGSETLAADNIDDPDIVTEVREAFEAYNRAIEIGDTAALNGFFWQSPKTVRFGPA